MKLKIQRKSANRIGTWVSFCNKEGIPYDQTFDIEWAGTLESFNMGMFDLPHYRSASGSCFDVLEAEVQMQAPTVKAEERSFAVIPAPDFLKKGLNHMEDRAATYDKKGCGERSMAKTVVAFNAITGHNLTEEEGWLFMENLKQVRSLQGNFKADNYEDLAAYAALRGECASRERGGKS